jgi:hypothetical protein
VARNIQTVKAVAEKLKRRTESFIAPSWASGLNSEPRSNHDPLDEDGGDGRHGVSMDSDAKLGGKAAQAPKHLEVLALSTNDPPRWICGPKSGLARPMERPRGGRLVVFFDLQLLHGHVPHTLRTAPNW